MKKIILIFGFVFMSLFVSTGSEATLKSSGSPITIGEAIELAIGQEPGVAMNVRWQSGYMEITIAGDEVRVEKLYVNPVDGRIAGVNLKDNEDPLASSSSDIDVKLDYIGGYYEIEILKFDGTVRSVLVNEEDGAIFYR
jgi:hypothetical protein